MSKPTQYLPKLKPLNLDGSPVDLNFFLTTDYQDATVASVEIPALIEYINENLQVMIEGKIRAKADLERLRGKAYLDLKRGLWETRGYEGKPTDKGVEAAIEQEETVIEAHEQVAIFSGYVSRLHNLIAVLHAKLDITRTSESTRRALLESSDRGGSEE